VNKAIIRNILKNKISSWLRTIGDDEVREAAADSVIVSGGAIASLLTQEKVNDYDCYFTDFDAAVAVVRYYVDKFNSEVKVSSKVKEVVPEVVIENDRIKIKIKSAGVATVNSEEMDYEYFEYSDKADTYLDGVFKTGHRNNNEGYVPIVLTDNAITLSQDIQLIHRFHGEPDDIHKNFDFVHVTNYYVYKTNQLVLRPAALESLLLKRLVYVGSLYPVASILRLRKYLRRDWQVSAGQMIKIIFQVNQLNLNDPAVLAEQLIGVDIAYMKEILLRIKQDNPESIDAAYLSNLIDEVFDN
jgi:hypothetical protein